MPSALRLGLTPLKATCSHVLIEVVAFALAGAALLAGIATIRNWLIRKT